MKTRLIASAVLLFTLFLTGVPHPATAAMMPYNDIVDISGKKMTLKQLEAKPKKNADGSIQLNNTKCPVSGNPVDLSLGVAHENVHYFVADKRAYVRFRKNPAKYALDEKVKV